MPKIDSLKEKIGYLREQRKDFFLLLVAVLSGVSGVFYAVLSGEKPIFVTFIAIIGVMISIFLIVKLMKFDKDINIKLNELEDL